MNLSKGLPPPVNLNKLPSPTRSLGASPLFGPNDKGITGPVSVDPDRKGTTVLPLGAPPHPAAPPAPGVVPGAAPAAAPPPPPLPYLDSTYYQNVANNDFRVNNQIAGLQRQQAYGNDDLQRALLQLTHSAALQERQDREQANNAGLLSSTTLASTLGEHARSAGDQRTSLQTQNSRSNAQILSEILAAQGGQTLFDQTQRLDAALRQAAADAANPALGEPLPGAPASPSPPKPPAAPKPPASVHRTPLDPDRKGTTSGGGLLRPARRPPINTSKRRLPPINTNKGY